MVFSLEIGGSKLPKASKDESSLAKFLTTGIMDQAANIEDFFKSGQQNAETIATEYVQKLFNEGALSGIAAGAKSGMNSSLTSSLISMNQNQAANMVMPQILQSRFQLPFQIFNARSNLFGIGQNMLSYYASLRQAEAKKYGVGVAPSAPKLPASI